MLSAPHPSRVGPARSFRRADVYATVLFVLVPILLYVPSAIGGHPVIPGDDLIQNEPLRALAGELLRSGRLPAWNPLIWSGTPLLAGWNAGAMFPGTWLFSFVPAVASWTINMCSAPILCGTGTYLFLRRRRIAPLGSCLGALLFTYTGFMSGQIVHLGLVQGTAFTPWMLVGLDLVPSAPNRRRLLGATLLTGTAFGLVILAGDPRAISSAIAIVGIVFLALCWRHRDRIRELVGSIVLASILGLLLGAVQWLPGVAFLRSSQRNGAGYGFFASGSLSVTEIFRGMLVPFLTGANGNLGSPLYQGQYNLPELTIGVGLVALIAGVAYFPDLWHDLGRWYSHVELDETRRPLGTIYTLIALGTLLTLGSYTPLGHVFAELPLFGAERLQNRNFVLCDFALAWLCAYFVDDKGAVVLARSVGVGTSKLVRDRRPVILLIPIVTTAIVLVAIVAPGSVESALEYTGALPSVIHKNEPYLLATAVLAMAVGAFVLLARRMPTRARTVMLVCLVVADVLDYTVQNSYATAPSAVLASSNSLSDQVAGVTGPQGRFALYNPAYAPGGVATDTIPLLGVSDLNVVHGIGSVQGYGSIVSGVYQTGTATHLFQDLDAAALGGESFNTLDLQALLSLPTYFDEVIATSAGVPVAERPDAAHSSDWTLKGANVTAPLPYSGGPWSLTAVRPRYFTLPTPISLRSVNVILDRDGPTYPKSLTIEVMNEQRVLSTTTVPVVDGHAVASVSTAPSNYIRIGDPHVTPAIIGAVLANSLDPSQRLLLDGALQGQLAPDHWHYEGTIDSFVVFENLQTLGLAWLQPATSKTPNVADQAGGSVAVRENTPTAPQVLTVDASEATQLVRSEGFASGWSATLVSATGGKTLTRRVHQFGLVQAVAVPKGDWTITFSYQPDTLLSGFILSAIGTFALLLACLCLLLSSMRQRKRVEAKSGQPLQVP